MATEDLDAAIRDLQRQRRRGRWRLYGIIVLVALTPVMLLAHNRYKEWRYRRSQLLDTAGNRELRDLLAELSPKAAECRAVWERQTRPETLAALRIDPEAGCAVDLPTASEKEGKDYVEFASWSGGSLFFGGWWLHLVTADAKVEGSGGCTSELFLKALAESVDRGEARKTDLSDARWELNRRDGYEVVFLVTKQEQGMFNWAPKFAGIDSFTPGTIRGRALVYSLADRRFVCGGEIEARNSPTVDIHYTHFKGDPLAREAKASAASEVLKRDLEVQLRRQIASGLSALAAPENK